MFYDEGTRNKINEKLLLDATILANDRIGKFQLLLF